LLRDSLSRARLEWLVRLPRTSQTGPSQPANHQPQTASRAANGPLRSRRRWRLVSRMLRLAQRRTRLRGGAKAERVARDLPPVCDRESSVLFVPRCLTPCSVGARAIPGFIRDWRSRAPLQRTVRLPFKSPRPAYLAIARSRPTAAPCLAPPSSRRLWRLVSRMQRRRLRRRRLRGDAKADRVALDLAPR
jgi:hypothetical protein